MLNFALLRILVFQHTTQVLFSRAETSYLGTSCCCPIIGPILLESHRIHGRLLFLFHQNGQLLLDNDLQLVRHCGVLLMLFE